MDARPLYLFPLGGYWRQVKRTDASALALIDGTHPRCDGVPHYSRQTPGAAEFMSSGKTLVLVGVDDCAVWGVIENRVPGGAELRWRCSAFRNVDPSNRSSDLIREATWLTYRHWERRYHGRPAVPLTTEIDASKVRRKRDPGRCFLRAGWRKVREHRGLIVFEAPAY